MLPLILLKFHITASFDFISIHFVALGESAGTAETITGLIMSGATVLGYLLAEGLADAAEAGSETVIQIGADEMIEEKSEDKE